MCIQSKYLSIPSIFQSVYLPFICWFFCFVFYSTIYPLISALFQTFIKFWLSPIPGYLRCRIITSLTRINTRCFLITANTFPCCLSRYVVAERNINYLATLLMSRNITSVTFGATSHGSRSGCVFFPAIRTIPRHLDSIPTRISRLRSKRRNFCLMS